MFEDSLVMGRRAGSLGRLVVGSLVVQACVVVGLVGVPLLWPAVLPVVVAAPRVVSVALRKAEVKTKPAVMKVTNEAAVRVPSAAGAVSETRVSTSTARGVIGRGPTVGAGDPAVVTFGSGMSASAVMGVGLGGDTGGHVAVVVKAAGPVRVSSGVVAGLLLGPITPAYPGIAKAAHVSGTVVLTATIDKGGRIVGVQVVSGPVMLRGAAVSAVEMARYRPYLLNGEATEVVTTISVVFTMGGA